MPARIGLAGVCERIQVRDRARGENTLVLRAKRVVTARHHRHKSILLPQEQTVYVDFRAGQFRKHNALQIIQFFL